MTHHRHTITHLPLLLIILILTATSCHTNRQTPTTPYTPDTTATTTTTLPTPTTQKPTTTPRPTPTQHRQATLLNHPTDNWQQIQTPITITAQGNTYSGLLTMTRSRDINISIRLLGLELAAINITPDTIQAHIKPTRTYISEPISTLLPPATPITLQNLQSLILSRLFTLGTDTPNLQTPTYTNPTPTTLQITPPPPHPNTTYTFTLDTTTPQHPTLTTLTLNLPTAHTATIQYTHQKNNPTPPTDIHITYTPPKRQPINLHLTLNPDRTTWTPLTNPRPYRIPPGYTRIPAATLLKKLKNQ